MWLWNPRTKRIALLALCAVLAACQAPKAPQVTPADGSKPILRVDEVLRKGEIRFLIQPHSSHAEILVRREGPLARFGHDHALVARPNDGFVIWSDDDPHSSRGAFAIEVHSIEVDPPNARAAFQLDTTPDQDAIAATRNNLLQHVLRASEWPTIQVTVHVLDGARPNIHARAELLINGSRNHVEFPMKIQISGTTLSASGRFEISQQDWGIEPFAVLGGGLRVADTVGVRFEINARRERPDDK